MALSKRYTFFARARARANEVNQNFDDIIAAYNTHTHTNTGTDAPLITNSGLAAGSVQALQMNVGAVSGSALAPTRVSQAYSPGSAAAWGDFTATSKTFTVANNATVGLIWVNYGGQFNSAAPSVTTGMRLMDGATVIVETRLDVGVTGGTSSHSWAGAYTFSAGSHTTKIQTSVNAGAYDQYYGNYLILLVNQ